MRPPGIRPSSCLWQISRDRKVGCQERGEEGEVQGAGPHLAGATGAAYPPGVEEQLGPGGIADCWGVRPGIGGS